MAESEPVKVAEPIPIDISDPQADVVETTAQRVLMHCGVGSGKSHCIGIISFDFIKNNPEVRGFIGANTYRQLSQSTLDRVFKIWEGLFNLKRDVHYVVDKIPPDNFKIYGAQLKSYQNTISFQNGALIYIASLDNYKVLDGTEFGWACLDETKDTKEAAVKEVIVARLRQVGMWISPKGNICNKEKPGYNGYNPLYIFTSPAKTRWLSVWFNLQGYHDEIEKIIYNKKEYFRKRVGDKLIVIASSYHNEKNLSKGYLNRMADDLGHDKNRVNMLIYGSPFGKTGGEFYSAYSRTKHVKPTPFDPTLPVHISFDFNLRPYMTMTLWQIYFNKTEKRYKARAWAELCLPEPDNNTEALCEKAIALYGDKFKRGLFYYGDHSGFDGNTVSKDYKHRYEVVEKVMKKYLHNQSNRVIVNPLLVKRRDFMNKLLLGKLPVDIEIDPSCVELIADFEFVKVDINGGKDKAEVTDEHTGKKYQEHGHTSDSADYMLCSAFDFYFNA